MPADVGLVRHVKNTFAPARRKFELLRKQALMSVFRTSVNVARAVRLLPVAAKLDAPLHILIVNLTPHLGDAIMLMPLVEALRREHPEARIEMAVETGGAPLLCQMADLNRVYALPLGGVPPVGFWQACNRALRVTREYLRTMRCVKPTVCLLPRWGDDLFRSAVLAYLTGAPRRVGFASSVISSAPYRDKLLTEAVVAGSGIHETARFLMLARDAGLLHNADVETLVRQPVLSLRSIATGVDWQSLRLRLGIPEGPVAVVAPGASMAKRMWPVERWAMVIAELAERRLHVVVLAGKADAQVAAALHTLVSGQSTLVAGATTLMESVALIAHAEIFLGGDSGPGHIAGALGIATVTLFISQFGADPDGPSAPERVHPLGPHVRCLTPQCMLPPCKTMCIADAAHCITEIDVQDVVRAAND